MSGDLRSHVPQMSGSSGWSSLVYVPGPGLCGGGGGVGLTPNNRQRRTPQEKQRVNCNDWKMNFPSAAFSSTSLGIFESTAVLEPTAAFKSTAALPALLISTATPSPTSTLFRLSSTYTFEQPAATAVSTVTPSLQAPPCDASMIQMNLMNSMSPHAPVFRNLGSPSGTSTQVGSIFFRQGRFDGILNWEGRLYASFHPIGHQLTT